MRREEKRGRFGELMPLGREDFVKEVTEGSRLGADGEVDVNEDEEDGDEEEEGVGATGQGGRRQDGRLRGTGVVVFLFKDS